MSSDIIATEIRDEQVTDSASMECPDIPHDWVMLVHDSGLMIYYNKVTSVATLSQPFPISLDEVKSTPVPVSALPLLKFRSHSQHPPTSFQQSFQSPQENGVDSEIAQSKHHGETAEETSETDKKEEGELTSDEDNDSREGSVSPSPAKRQYRDGNQGEKSSECAPNVKDVSEQKISFKEDVRNRLLNLKVLNPDELRQYCKLFQNNGFRCRWERQRFNKSTRLMQMLGDKGNSLFVQKAKERVISNFRKPPISVLHEYCQSVLKVQSHFTSMPSGNDKLPFHYAVVVDNKYYPTGSGSSKKSARSEAARLALMEMLPEYKTYCEQNHLEIISSESTIAQVSEADLDLFSDMSVTDKKVFEIVCERQLNWAAPYTLFGEYVKRHCIPESDIVYSMTDQGKNKHLFELRFMEHHVQVQCKNKRTGRNFAAQEILARLHPQAETWRDLLDLYGPNTRNEKKLESELIAETQVRQAVTIKPNLIRLLREKMLALANQDDEKKERKGKFVVSPTDLPVVEFHPDSRTNAQMNYDNGEILRNPTEFSAQNTLTRNGESNLSRPRGFDSGSISTLEEHSRTEGMERQPLTLVQLRQWLIEPERRLKVLASLVDNCSSLKGGALVSKVYEMSQNGGPKIKAMLTVILENVTRTIFEMISLWIYDGRLPPDINQEFFISVYPSVGRENLWVGKYCLRKGMIPEFISNEQARKILLVGKSVNFLIHVCNDSLNFKDLEAIRNTRLKQVEAIFNQTFDRSFDRMISTAYTHVSKHLLEILFQKYHFMDHLTACRKFLLLGQGDFIQRLIDLLQVELDEPACSIMRHRLNEILETAIRDTNAQYEDSEILRRLNVEVLETAEGDSGWDVFSLGYTIDGPLTTIFPPECRLFYLKAFSFLWRLKRMEFMLSALWRDQLSLARKPYALADDLAPILHVVQLLGAEFRHFILQLQYYINFEALECAWLDLAKVLQSANDLDEVIAAHQAFLESVVARCLLDQNSRDLRYHLRAIFDLIINFFQLNQDLQSLANDEEDVRSQLQYEIDASAKTGNWGTCAGPECREVARRKMFVEATITPLTARIRVLASSYRSMVTEFMNKLQNHSDQNLRLLVQSLNFNAYYIDGFGDI
nr:gamma tubulin complex component 3 [Hymenolepis microstoma]